MTVKPFMVGHPLEDSPVLSKSQARRVRSLGISTLEELHDLLGQSQLPGSPFRADDFLEVADLEGLRRRVGEAMAPPRKESSGQKRSARRRSTASQGDGAAAFDSSSFGFVPRRPTGALAPAPRLWSDKAEEGAAALGDSGGKAAKIHADLRDHFSGIRSQGERGTCVAHAVVALMEHVWKKNRKQTQDFSEQFLYWNCKRQDNAPQLGGTYQRIAIAVLVSEGVCREKTWPYNLKPDADNEGQGPPPSRAQVVDEALRYRPTQGIARDPRSSQVIRELMDEDTPVAVSVPVYPSWWGQTTDLYGQIPMPRPGEQAESGHAVCLVGYGYDPDFSGGGFFIIRNSWGAGWASQSPFGPGYGSIPFAYIDHYNWESFCVT